MLSKNSVMTSIALATELAEKGLIVTAKPNTVVGDLVRLTNASLVSDFVVCEGNTQDNIMETFADVVEKMTQGDLQNVTEHSKASDAYIEEIKNACKRHVSFAKNIVGPIVMDYANNVKTYMDNFKPPQAASNFNIEICEIPELLEDESFVDTLRFYNERSALTPDLIPAFGPRTDEELQALLTMGDQDADEAIVAWYTRKGPDFFQNVWFNFFLNRKDVNGQFISYEELFKFNVFERADYALAIYLFVEKLFENVPEDIKGLSLQDYQTTLAQSRDFAGAILADFVSVVESYENAGTLVISIAQNQKGASVFGRVYNKWLETGGCPEVIIGLIISGKNFRLKSLIDEDRENLLSKWETYENFHNAAQSNKYFDHFKDALRLKFAELMSGTTEEEEAFIKATPNYVAKVNENFERELEELRSPDFDNVYILAMKLICRSRFYYTDAELILLDMEEARKCNPNIDVREAAFIATANYVFDYLADQLLVVADR